MHAKLSVLFTAAMLISAAAHADEPTVRSVYSVCRMDAIDACGEGIKEAVEAFVADPTWNICYAGPEQNDPACPMGGRLMTNTCRVSASFPWSSKVGDYFMLAVSMHPSLLPEPARHGIYEALNMMGACGN